MTMGGEGVVTPTILVDGQDITGSIELLTIDVHKEVNRIPTAQLQLVDGTDPLEPFAMSNADTFALGKAIEIKLRYEGEGDDTTVFKGLVTGHSISASQHGSRLTIDLKDGAVGMTRGRRSAIYREQTDKQIIEALISDNGLTVGSIADTTAEHVEMVQYQVTDWDFLVSRAEANGLLVAVDDGTVSANEIVLESAENVFTFGVNIYALDIEAGGVDQLPGVEAVYWDGKELALSKPASASSVSITPGNFEGQAAGEALGYGDISLVSAVPLNPDEQSAWAQGVLARSRLALQRGRITVAGSAALKPLDVIKLEAIGDRFNGDALVTGVRQQVTNRGWLTSVQLGLSPQWLTRKPDVVDSPAAGLVPGVNGLQIGIVDAFEEDPDGEARLRIRVPALNGDETHLWARLVTPDGGSDRGFVFRPEPDDEVVVGFLNDDPRYPVVLGSLFSSANAPPEAIGDASEDNFLKGLVTREGMMVILDDEKKVITIETPAGNKMVIDDDGTMIEIADQNGNTVTLNGDGITLKSDGDIVIEAGGNITIKGSQVDVQ